MVLTDDVLERVWDNRFAPLRLLGSGGQGRVVLARDQVLKRDVAVKLRPVGPDDDRGELLNEARVLLSIPPHRGVAMVRADFFDHGYHGLVMDYVTGATLREQMAGPVTSEAQLMQVREWVRAIAAALDHLHAQSPSIVHGDVKPSNVVLDEHSQAPVLVDFGMATGDRATPAGQGTRGFAAPELSRGQATPAADVYGLAATAYALLTGERPSPGGGTELAPAVRAVLARGLSASPAARPGSAGEFAHALSDALGLPEPVASTKARRPRTLVALGVALAAGAALLFATNRSPTTPRVAANASATSTQAPPANVELVTPVSTPTSAAPSPSTVRTGATTVPVAGTPAMPVAQLALLTGEQLQVVAISPAGEPAELSAVASGATGWTTAARIRAGQLLLYRRSDGHNRLVEIDSAGAITLGRTNPEVPAGLSHVVGLGQGIVFFYRQSDGYAATHRYGERLRLADQDSYPATQNLGGYDRVEAADGVVVLYRSATGAARLVRFDDLGAIRVGPEQSLAARWTVVAPLAGDALLGMDAAGEASLVRVRGDGLVATRVGRFAGPWTDAARFGGGALLYDRASGHGAVLGLTGNDVREVTRFSLAPRGVLAAVD